MTRKLSLAELHAPELLRYPAKTLGQLRHRWDLWARPAQLTPAGAWRRWVILAGRGWGKTRTGAEAIRQAVDEGAKRIALVGATVADVRDVMIDGESGLLAVFPRHQQPNYQTSKRRVVFHTGAYATIYTSEKPRQLRGPQHELAWCDELAAWTHLEETYSNLDFGLRLGVWPRVMVTTTPLPLDLLKAWVEEARDPRNGVIITRGRTVDNAANLPPDQLRRWLEAYGGTRLGRQELDGEILPDLEGALFRREWFVHLPAPAKLTRVVVSIDPAYTQHRDETGILVVGRLGDKAYVLEDLSGRWSPQEWSTKAVAALRRWRQRATAPGSCCIVVEENHGGDLVPHTIRSAIPQGLSIPIKTVDAHEGKNARAEPIAALYEQRRVVHVDRFEKLESQMTTWNPTGRDSLRSRGGGTSRSPDRMDAVVWGISELGFHIGAARFTPHAVPNPFAERPTRRRRDLFERDDN